MKVETEVEEKDAAKEVREERKITQKRTYD